MSLNKELKPNQNIMSDKEMKNLNRERKSKWEKGIKSDMEGVGKKDEIRGERKREKVSYLIEKERERKTLIMKGKHHHRGKQRFSRTEKMKKY